MTTVETPPYLRTQFPHNQELAWRRSRFVTLVDAYSRQLSARHCGIVAARAAYGFYTHMEGKDDLAFAVGEQDVAAQCTVEVRRTAQHVNGTPLAAVEVLAKLGGVVSPLEPPQVAQTLMAEQLAAGRSLSIAGWRLVSAACVSYQVESYASGELRQIHHSRGEVPRRPEIVYSADDPNAERLLGVFADITYHLEAGLGYHPPVLG